MYRNVNIKYVLQIYYAGAFQNYGKNNLNNLKFSWKHFQGRTRDGSLERHHYKNINLILPVVSYGKYLKHYQQKIEKTQNKTNINKA